MSHASDTKRDLRKAAAEAEVKRQEHEQKLTKMILDWITTVKPERGDIIVLTVPKEFFPYPGTAPEDITTEQSQMMESAHSVLGTLCDSLIRQGILPGGGAILGEGMTLSDIPPPWEKHPDSRSPIALPDSRIVLPPGTKL